MSLTGSEVAVEVLKEVRNELRGVNARIDGINARLDAVNTRLEGVIGRLELVKTGPLDELLSARRRSPPSF